MTDEFPDAFVSTQRYRARFSGAVGRLYLRKQLSFITECLTEYGCKTVLEIGAGHGQVCNDLLKQNFSVTCVVSDYSYAQLIDPKAQLIVHPILEYKPSAQFDAVIALKTLGHTSQPDKFLANIANNAKVIILDYPSSRSFARLSKFGYFVKKFIEKHVRPFDTLDPSWVKKIMSELGYRLVKSVGLFFLPVVCYRFCSDEAVIEKIENALNVDFLKSPRIECFVKL